MTIKDCIQYEEKNISEQEVVKILETYDIMKEVSPEIYNDVLFLLNKKELIYFYFYKEKDRRTPILKKIFSELEINVLQSSSYVKLKNNVTYIKVVLSI